MAIKTGADTAQSAANSGQQPLPGSTSQTGSDLRQISGGGCQQPAVKLCADLVETEAEGGQKPSQADDGHPQVTQAVFHQQVATLQRGLEGDGFAACAARRAPARLDKGEPAGEVGKSQKQPRMTGVLDLSGCVSSERAD